MYDIPRPEVLDPKRLGANRDSMGFVQHSDVSDRLYRELRETCEYAQQLWDQLAEVRRYLVNSLPVPSSEGPDGLGSAAPRGRDDAAGWRSWTEIYAGVVSVLEGPRRDSGFAFEEARQIARSRLEFSADQQPTLETIERH